MQQEGKKKKKAPMASSVPDLGETNLTLYKEGGGGNRGGDGMFQLMAKLVAVMVEMEAHRPCPFISRRGRLRWRDIFSPTGGYFPPRAHAQAR
jgi:hypothetical protein